MHDRDDPEELTTVADDDAPLTRDEAAAAGMLADEPVYGESSLDPNAADKRDSERGA